MVEISSNNKSHFMGEINVVPLVDVMLVLLVIFMVTAPMIVQSLDIKLPETTATATLTEKEGSIIITIIKDGRLFLDEVLVAENNLAQKLTEVIACKSDTKVYLRADKDVPYGIVVKAMAEIRNVGISNLGMVTEPEKLLTLPEKKKKS